MLALPKGVEAISWVVASASILSKVGGRSRWQRVLPRVCPVADGGIMESLSYKSSESMRDWKWVQYDDFLSDKPCLEKF